MKNKILLAIAGALVLIIGAVLGAWFANYYIVNHKDVFCSRTPSVAPSQDQINNLTLLKPGQVFFGKVASKTGNQIVVNVQFTNPLNPSDVKNIPVKVVFSSADEFLRFKKNDKTKSLDIVKASASDINAGDIVTVKILTDKKVIYLPTAI